MVEPHWVHEPSGGVAPGNPAWVQSMARLGSMIPDQDTWAQTEGEIIKGDRSKNRSDRARIIMSTTPWRSDDSYEATSSQLSSYLLKPKAIRILDSAPA